jgi:hypothetical protein
MQLSEFAWCCRAPGAWATLPPPIGHDHEATASKFVWGFSAAGGHAIYTAAGDQEIAAAVARCPVTDLIAFMLRMPIRNSLRLALDAFRNAARRRPVHIPAVGPPRSYAVLTQREALPGFAAI